MTIYDLLWDVGVFVATGLTVFAIVGFRIHRPKLRWIVRIVGLLVSPLTLFLLGAWLFGVFAYPTSEQTLKSPDSRHIACVERDSGGVFSDDLWRVSVRHSWSPIAGEVYNGTLEPKVTWLNAHTLEIFYPRQSAGDRCGKSWMNIDVTCRVVSK